MSDEQDRDLSAESENPEEEVQSAEASEPAGDSADAAGDSADAAGDSADAAGDSADAAGDGAEPVGDAGEPEAEASEPEAAASEPEAEADGGDVAVSDADPEAEAVADGVDEIAAAGDDDKVVDAEGVSEDEAEAAMLEMLEGLPEQDDKAGPDDINFGAAAASNAEFQQLQEPVTPPESRNIDLLMDVDLPISIELGHTKMSISDILGLGTGSVVELNKLAGEPVDLLVNYKVVAKGEVVVVDENFGLRITQLMTPEERLKALAEE